MEKSARDCSKAFVSVSGLFVSLALKPSPLQEVLARSFPRSLDRES